MTWTQALWVIIFFILTGLIPLQVTMADQLVRDITVRVVGLQSNNGEVRFGLYDNTKAFAQGPGHAMVKGTCPIVDYICEFTIPNVPYGVYAIMVGHDVNGDGNINRSPWSRERKGISGYKKKLLFFPDFDQAKFDHNKDNTISEISVH